MFASQYLKMKLVALALGSLLAAACSAQSTSNLVQRKECVAQPPFVLASGNSKPLVVLTEENPWLSVIGSDSPTFALYSNGEAIYRSGEGFKFIRLSEKEVRALLVDLDVGALSCLKGEYEASEATDQPTETIVVNHGLKPTVVSVYGTPDKENVPVKFRTAYDRLRSFSHPAARDWLPAKIEVMIWPYEYAPEPSVIWPKDWPGIDDPATMKRGEDSYSLFVSSSDYPKLVRFLKTQRERGAVEIGGKKWAVSYRFPFPDLKP